MSFPFLNRPVALIWRKNKNMLWAGGRDSVSLNNVNPFNYKQANWIIHELERGRYIIRSIYYQTFLDGNTSQGLKAPLSNVSPFNNKNTSWNIISTGVDRTFALESESTGGWLVQSGTSSNLTTVSSSSVNILQETWNIYPALNNVS